MIQAEEEITVGMAIGKAECIRESPRYGQAPMDPEALDQIVDVLQSIVMSMERHNIPVRQQGGLIDQITQLRSRLGLPMRNWW